MTALINCNGQLVGLTDRPVSDGLGTTQLGRAINGKAYLLSHKEVQIIKCNSDV